MPNMVQSTVSVKTCT